MLENSLTGDTGATAHSVGVSAIDNTATNAMNYPVEVLDADVPIMIERNEIRYGSGGVGRMVGCDGMRRVYRFLEPGKVNLRAYRTAKPPAGAAGGHPGAGARFTLRRPDAGIGYVTPDDEHTGRGKAIRQARPTAARYHVTRQHGPQLVVTQFSPQYWLRQVPGTPPRTGTHLGESVGSPPGLAGHTAR